MSAQVFVPQKYKWNHFYLPMAQTHTKPSVAHTRTRERCIFIFLAVLLLLRILLLRSCARNIEIRAIEIGKMYDDDGDGDGINIITMYYYYYFIYDTVDAEYTIFYLGRVRSVYFICNFFSTFRFRRVQCALNIGCCVSTNRSLAEVWPPATPTPATSVSVCMCVCVRLVREHSFHRTDFPFSHTGNEHTDTLRLRIDTSVSLKHSNWIESTLLYFSQRHRHRHSVVTILYSSQWLDDEDGDVATCVRSWFVRCFSFLIKLADSLCACRCSVCNFHGKWKI